MATEATVTDDAAPDATQATASEAGGGAAPDKAATEVTEPSGPWGDDWREKIAGGDEKELKRLQRMSSPADVWKSFRSMESEFAARKPAPELPENPTEKDVAEYRKASGIPETFEGYLDNLPDGLVVGEADRPIVDTFLKSMHDKNMPPAAVHEAMNWYYSEIEARRDALAEEDKRAQTATDDELRGEWGADYRANYNSVKALLASAPGELSSLLEGGRLADGTPIMASPDFLRWTSQLSRDLNPAGTVVPGGSAQQVQSLEAKKAELESLMRSDPRAYDKRREEYRQVVGALEKIQSRAA